MHAPKQQPHTIQSTLQQAQQSLSERYDSARLDTEVLLAHVLGKSRTYLHTWPTANLSRSEQGHFAHLLQRRLAGEPIAYIIGQQAFWSLNLKVTPATLIPRPETEHLVEQALARLPQDKDMTIVDLGTGCGVIALAIAKERSHCHIIAVESSPAAITVAKQNASHLKIDNVTFIEGCWLEPLEAKTVDMIVSNPPYVATDDPHLKQGDVKFEPSSALLSGSDGLKDIRIIIATAREHLKTSGWLLLEHGHDQGPAVTELLQQAGYTNISDYPDLAGQPRIAAAQWPV